MATGLQHVLITGPPGIGKTTLVCKICAVLMKHHQVTVQGFYTEEVRGDYHGASGGRIPRVGFDVVTLDGKRAPLARVKNGESGSRSRSSFTVGKYAVDVESFESVALPAMARTLSQNMLGGSGGRGDIERRGVGAEGSVVLVIDEVGKMELFSRLFVERVDLLFKATTQDHVSSTSKASATASVSAVPKRLLLLATIPVARSHQKMHWLVQTLKERDDCVLFQVTEKNRDKLEEDILAFILKRI